MESILVSKYYKPGQPCHHSGCLHHNSHPCEECGRIAGIGSATVYYKPYSYTTTTNCIICGATTDMLKTQLCDNCYNNL